MLFFTGVCYSLTINIAGTVENTDGVKISGATVELDGSSGNTATTDENGSFTLNFPFTGVNSIPSYATPEHILPISITRNAITVHLKKESVVNLSIFSIHGKALYTHSVSATAGEQAFTIPSMSHNLCIYKISLNKVDYIFTGPNLETCNILKNTIIQPMSTRKTSVVTNSTFNSILKVTKEGMIDYYCDITSPDTSGLIIRMIQSGETLTDADGNVYQTVRINNTIWTTSNLRTTKYIDGTDIILDSLAANWLTSKLSHYCYYNNDVSNIKKYGLLYTWYAAKRIIPEGWRFPTTSDFALLHGFLKNTFPESGGSKAMASKIDWIPTYEPGPPGYKPETNNCSGFSALPGGMSGYGNTYGVARQGVLWWTSSEVSTSEAYSVALSGLITTLNITPSNKNFRLYVRLVKTIEGETP
jgi:uncharacterized protein (TIGR02145 family)